MKGGIVCFKKTCQKQITSAHASICCWICNNVAHAKCAGFSGPTADAVAKLNGLHYCCDACREVENDFVSFMRQTRTGFRELFGNFRKLADQFSALDTSLNSLKL